MMVGVCSIIMASMTSTVELYKYTVLECLQAHICKTYLWCDIPGSEPGPSSGEDEGQLQLITPPPKNLLHRVHS